MGSLCCVAARPHGSGATSREWAMGGPEPFWRTNSSFSPPLSRRWEQRLYPEGLSYGSQDDSAIALYASSLSTSSEESPSWVRDELVPNHYYSASVGGVSYFSSPASSYQDQQLTPPAVQGVISNIHLCAAAKEPPSEPRAFSRIGEGSSGILNSIDASSSMSDGSDPDFVSSTQAHSYSNFASCYSFMLNHFPVQTFEGDEDSGSSVVADTHRTLHSNLNSVWPLNEPQSFSAGTLHSEALRWSGSSSMESTDIFEPLNSDYSGFLLNENQGNKCGLCDKYLSQRSPWSSCRIVRNGDMPVTGILPCQHVYHAECLERTIPKVKRHDPPCPLCEKLEETVPERCAVRRLKSGFPRLKSLGGEGPSRSWGCGQVGDCVEGALHLPSRNSTLILNQKRLKRHLSLKSGNSGKEQTENSKRSTVGAPHGLIVQKLADRGGVGCSKTGSRPAFKRW